MKHSLQDLLAERLLHGREQAHVILFHIRSQVLLPRTLKNRVHRVPMVIYELLNHSDNVFVRRYELDDAVLVRCRGQLRVVIAARNLNHDVALRVLLTLASIDLSRAPL